ncbi:transposase [Levilactobacillus brevis]|nr:transposase [Levilactobacillus brevis]
MIGFTFPTVVHSSIYSTNLIEMFNKKTKCQTKKKKQFSNESTLERVLGTVIRDYNSRNFERTQRGFKQI